MEVTGSRWPIDTANTRAWRRALTQGGIESFRWHHLRHTWASGHVQNGTPLHLLQELGGWACFGMVRRYAHLSAEHLAAYAGNVSKIRAVTSTLLGTLALVYSWLSQLMPVANGGPYAYTREGLGDFAAFLVAWGYWISIWSTNAAIAVAFLSYLTVFIPSLGVNPIFAITVGLSAIWLLTWINTKGIRNAGKVQVITTFLKIAPLLLVTIGGIFFIHTENYFPFNTSGTSNLSAITATATLTLFAFLGLECATIPSGQVENPEKTIPRATLYGTLAVTGLYIFGTVVIMGVLSPADLQTSKAPFADAAASMWGEWARYLVAGGAVMSTFGAMNGWIMMQGQIPSAAAVDKLFPTILKKENKFGVSLRKFDLF